MRRLPDLPRLCLAITERAPLPMATLEGATRIVRYGNRAFCHLVGRQRKHFVGRPIDELLPKKDVCLALIKRVYHTRKSENFTERERVKPHPIFWSYTIWPVEATHGLVNLMIQVTETAAVHGNAVAMNEALILSSVRQHEMTEAAESLNFRLQAELVWRQRAEISLRESETRYRRLFEAAHDGVLLLDPGTRQITDANPFMTKLLGCPHAQLVGKELFEIGLLKDAAASQAMFRKLKVKHKVRYEDLPLESDGGRHYEVEVVANLYTENNRPVIQCNIRDITARKRAELAQRRLAGLTAANKQANQEIARRRLVEAFLRESEQSQTRLLTESRALHGELRHLTRQIITAQEEERKRISRELHDDVLQTLVGINVAMAALAEPGASVAPSVLRPKIARTQRMVRESLLAVRRFARNLRPTLLDDFGLIPALEDYTQRLMEQKKFRIDLTTSGAIDSLDSIRTTVLFWVAQEALTNIARHARATLVRLHIGKIRGAVRMEVQDNGKSFPVQATLAPGKNKRLGLLGMRERMHMIGGTLVIKSTPGRGTLVRAEIPFTPAATI